MITTFAISVLIGFTFMTITGIVAQTRRQAMELREIERGVHELRQLRATSYEQIDQHRADELWRWNNPP